MDALKPSYDVILRQDLPPRERELLAGICCELSAPDGGSLLHFLCTRIDLSHHVFAELDVFRPGDAAIRSIRIPHHFIFLISGNAADLPIGFTAVYTAGS
jgi:hypothetical protein